MRIVLFILYTISFILQIVFLVQALRKPVSGCWKRLYLIELVSAAVSAAVAVYYNSLPASGFLGMTYLVEILLSAAAALLFAVMLILSFLLFLISRWKHKKRQKNAEA